MVMDQSKGAVDAQEEEILELAGDDQSPDEESAVSEESGETADPLDSLQKERDEYYDLLLRKQAEFENYRRRTSREREDSWAAAQAEVIRELLPIIDACEKGLESMPEDTQENSYHHGYSLLLRQLKGVLEKFGVSEVSGEGSTFDPNLHEAVLREMSRAYAENEVIEEFRKGYQMGDRLLRASQVKVAVWPDDETEEELADQSPGRGRMERKH